DILVNSAGFTRMVPHADLEAFDDNLIDAVLTANVRGSSLLTRRWRELDSNPHSPTVDAFEIVVFSYSGVPAPAENSNSFTGRGRAVRTPSARPTAGFWLCVQVGISACRPSFQSFLRLLTRRLEECPAAVADHPVARAGGIAGIAQVEPD